MQIKELYTRDASQFHFKLFTLKSAEHLGIFLHAHYQFSKVAWVPPLHSFLHSLLSHLTKTTAFCNKENRKTEGNMFLYLCSAVWRSPLWSAGPKRVQEHIFVNNHLRSLVRCCTLLRGRMLNFEIQRRSYLISKPTASLIFFSALTNMSILKAQTSSEVTWGATSWRDTK